MVCAVFLGERAQYNGFFIYVLYAFNEVVRGHAARVNV